MTTAVGTTEDRVADLESRVAALEADVRNNDDVTTGHETRIAALEDDGNNFERRITVLEAARRPPYNHTRGDSPETPCDLCQPAAAPLGESPGLPSVQEVMDAAEAFRQADTGGASFGKRSGLREELCTLVTTLHRRAVEAERMRGDYRKAHDEVVRERDAAAQMAERWKTYHEAGSILLEKIADALGDDAGGPNSQLPAKVAALAARAASLHRRAVEAEAARDELREEVDCAVKMLDATEAAASPVSTATADEIVEACIDVVDRVSNGAAFKVMEGIRYLRGRFTLKAPATEVTEEMISRFREAHEADTDGCGIDRSTVRACLAAALKAAP